MGKVPDANAGADAGAYLLTYKFTLPACIHASMRLMRPCVYARKKRDAQATL